MGRRIDRVSREKGHARRLGRGFLEQFQPLDADRRVSYFARRTGEVAARVGKARCASGSNEPVRADGHDGNRCGQSSRRAHPNPDRHDHVDPRRQHLLHQARHLVVPPFRRAAVDHDVAAFDPPEIAQAANERPDPTIVRHLGDGAAYEDERDAWQRFRLLGMRASGERQCARPADERPAIHHGVASCVSTVEYGTLGHVAVLHGVSVNRMLAIQWIRIGI